MSALNAIAVLDSQIAELRASGDTGNVENLVEARDAFAELIAFMRSVPCCCPRGASAMFNLVCERCLLLTRCGSQP